MSPRSIIKKDIWDLFFYHSAQFENQKKITDESFEDETAKVSYVLNELLKAGAIPNTNYDKEVFKKFRAAVKESFFIFWTAINPPMEHLLFALSWIIKPKNLIGLGIFTGNPVVWSMGPALLGVYPADQLIAVEIDKNNARICQDNFNALQEEIKEQNIQISDSAFTIKVQALGEDGFDLIPKYSDNQFDMVYLDANGFDPMTKKISKNINYSLLKAIYPKLKPGGIAACHNSYQPSFAKEAKMFLDFTADSEFFKKTFTLAIDEMGVEWAIKRTKEN